MIKFKFLANLAQYNSAGTGLLSLVLTGDQHIGVHKKLFIKKVTSNKKNGAFGMKRWQK